MIRSASSFFVSTQPVRAVRSPSQISSKSSPKNRWSWQTLQISGRPGSVAQDPLRVGDHAHDLAADDVRLGEDLDRVAERLAHLPDAVGPQHDGRGRVDGLRLGERVAVEQVEAPDDLARQLQVRGLVLADRDERRLVDDDVGRLQHRVREQAVVDVLGLVGLLLLVGRRALEPADRGDRREQPGELGVLRPVRLDEQRAALRVQAEGDERGRHLARALAEHVRVVQARQGVVVDDAVDRLVLRLQAHVVADRAEVVAQVGRAGRLDPGEDARPGRGRRGRGGRGGQLRRHRRRV